MCKKRTHMCINFVCNNAESSAKCLKAFFRNGGLPHKIVLTVRRQ